MLNKNSTVKQLRTKKGVIKIIEPILSFWRPFTALSVQVLWV